MIIPKRTKGKNNKCIGAAKMYKYYLNKCRNTDRREISYSKFSKIIKACNRELTRLCTEEAEIVRLPLRLGYLQVCKFDKSFNRIDKMIVDWKRTKEEGFIIYYDEKNIYKWCWLKKTSLVKNKSKYKFLACREAKRRVKIGVKELNIYYYGKPLKY